MPPEETASAKAKTANQASMVALGEADGQYPNLETLRLALDAGGLGYWEWNLQTGESRWDRQFALLVGLHPEEDAGGYEQFIARVYPDDRELIARYIEAAQTHGQEPQQAQFRVVHQDGSLHWITGRGRVYPSDDRETMRMIGVAWDSTEQKRREDEREEALRRERHARVEAEQANRAKDEFLASVSHELRSPLAAIVGWTSVLRSGKLDKKSAGNALATIERNALAQRHLIDDLLDAVSAVSGKLRLQKEAVELGAVVAEAITALRPSAEAKRIRLNSRIETRPIQLIGDAERLRQIASNLISNAIRFAPEGGEIGIEVSIVEGAQARLAVSGARIEINAELLPSLFEPFGQTKISLPQRSGDMRLELGLTRSLVELHGGTIEARSAGENGDATFVVTLPIAVELGEIDTAQTESLRAPDELIATREVEAGESSRELSELKVLVVDDEEGTRELFSFVLTQCGANVRACASAFEALRALSEWQPDALVCDIGMPEMDGYELIRRVRALPLERGGAIPAVAVTAFTRQEDRERALQSGFQMHLAKPIAPDELAAMVTTLVSGRAAGAPSGQPVKEREKTLPALGAARLEETPVARAAINEAQLAQLIETKEKATRNYLLAALPTNELERLLPYMETVKLNVNDILSQPDDPIRYVYFPTSAVISLLSITEDGASVEVGLVGREGMMGISLVLGFAQMPSWAMVTIAGEAIKINAEMLKRELQQGGALRDVLLNYTRTLITQISQNAVCNRRHSVAHRLCTWLLMIHDRVGRRGLALTQELIASRLGTRRAGISTSVKSLTEERILRTSRGKLRVLDREALEASACECYQIVKAEYDKIIAQTVGAL